MNLDLIKEYAAFIGVYEVNRFARKIMTKRYIWKEIRLTREQKVNRLFTQTVTSQDLGALVEMLREDPTLLASH